MSEFDYTTNLNPESLPGEEWRPIYGYGGNYGVSNFGRVRREKSGQGATPRKILRQTILSRPGYFRVGLLENGNQKTRTVHSLVAEAFIGIRQPGLCVNHKDGNKLNNLPENLEYMTLGENNVHAHKIGLFGPRVTACYKGHPYDEENTIDRGNGQRDCRECRRDSKKRYKDRKRLELKASYREAIHGPSD